MAMRKASKAQKRLLFIKIYNFAMEVYDSPGFGIGCWRSCGQQEWELISHEVILQLLFSCAHSLNTSNTSFSLLFVYALRLRILVLGRRTCVIFQREKVGDGEPRSLCLCAPCQWWLYVRENEGSTHSWMVGLLSWNHLSKLGEFGDSTERRREELLRNGTHAGNDGLSTKVRAP